MATHRMTDLMREKAPSATIYNKLRTIRYTTIAAREDGASEQMILAVVRRAFDDYTLVAGTDV